MDSPKQKLTSPDEGGFGLYCLVRRSKLPDDLTTTLFEIFLRAIFYLGYGTAERPADHVVEAAAAWMIVQEGGDEDALPDKDAIVIDEWTTPIHRSIVAVNLPFDKDEADAQDEEFAAVGAYGIELLSNDEVIADRGRVPSNEVPRRGGLLLSELHEVLTGTSNNGLAREWTLNEGLEIAGAELPYVEGEDDEGSLSSHSSDDEDIELP